LNAQALVDEARAAGIKFALADGQVRLAASAPPTELLARLREHKAEIATLLRKGSPELDETELEERKGLATDGVPEPYLDAWTRAAMPKTNGGFGCGMAAGHRYRGPVPRPMGKHGG
jgi:hypothetical protein